MTRVPVAPPSEQLAAWLAANADAVDTLATRAATLVISFRPDGALDVHFRFRTTAPQRQPPPGTGTATSTSSDRQ